MYQDAIVLFADHMHRPSSSDRVVCDHTFAWDQVDFISKHIQSINLAEGELLHRMICISYIKVTV